jgi:hypothetical protein
MKLKERKPSPLRRAVICLYMAKQTQSDLGRDRGLATLSL